MASEAQPERNVSVQLQLVPQIDRSAEDRCAADRDTRPRWGSRRDPIAIVYSQSIFSVQSFSIIVLYLV